MNIPLIRKRIPLWGWLVGVFIGLPYCILLLGGLISFTPLGALFGERWHYDGGIGLGKLCPLPNQSAIVYSSSRSGTSHIYSVNWNGNTSQQLTYDLNGDSDVCVSPNGKQITFVREDSQNMITHVWLMNTNGTGQHQITFGPASQMQPCFSPNGRTIAYSEHSRQAEKCPIWIININGTSPRKLTRGDIADTSPVFDVTGAMIYFTHQVDDNSHPLQIWAVSVASASEQFLGFGNHSAVSPNGAQIAYYDAPQNQTLGIMNTNGANHRIIGKNLGDGMNLAFCPNGKLLMYGASSSPDHADLVAIATNGGGQQRVASIEAGSR